MPSRNFEIVRQAICNRQQVIARYKGYHRMLCPHILGSTKGDTEQTLFYPFDGESINCVDHAVESIDD